MTDGVPHLSVHICVSALRHEVRQESSPLISADRVQCKAKSANIATVDAGESFRL
jgi:hypothetical protein